MKHFLLVYDLKTRERPTIRTFDRPAPAVRAYEEAEREYQGDDSIWVVLVGADDIESIETTHANLFGDSTIEKLLADVLEMRPAAT